MRTLNHTLMLFLIIIIEGYIVLSSELLAIRQTIPYIGSGTDTVSIIIAAVLMPLAFGYQFGGKFKQGRHFGIYLSYRKKLIFNILIAATILLVGLSHLFLRSFFPFLNSIGIEDRLAQISIYCLIFLVVPVYLLGQTVPLVSNFFSKERLSKITGKILFYSTVGSFLGAVFSTLVLMSTVGVHHTVTLNFILFTTLVIMLSRRKFSGAVIYCLVLTFCALFINSNVIMNILKVKKNNEHHMIVAGKIKNGDRILLLNGNFSSKYNDEKEKHNYIEFAERIAITPILDAAPPKNILVIGAGGFTFGHNDNNNIYTYVDIDEDLKEIAEKYILEEPLGKNKTFIPEPARAFLNKTKQKFDVIFLDAYIGGISIPEHMVTQEFFQQVKSRLNDNAVLMTNFILSAPFNNQFTRNIDNTIRSVFPHFSRHAIDDYYSLWSESETLPTNVFYIYKHETNYNLGHIYTDNLNTVFYDKPKKLGD